MIFKVISQYLIFTRWEFDAAVTNFGPEYAHVLIASIIAVRMMILILSTPLACLSVVIDTLVGLVFDSDCYRATRSTGWYTYYWWVSTISKCVGCTMIRDMKTV